MGPAHRGHRHDSGLTVLRVGLGQTAGEFTLRDPFNPTPDSARHDADQVRVF
jgi:hypothetical protein